ncbi:MAG TPA: dihydroorotase family protein, partial [Limnochordia bacterium]
ASDHAPHAPHEKAAADFEAAAAGVVGVETLLPLLIDAALAGRIRLEDVVAWTSERPAQLFGLAPRKGVILPGADADLVLVDPKAAWTIERARLKSRGKNTLFDGARGRGRVVATFLRGRCIARDGRIAAEPTGCWLTPAG